MWAAGEGVVWAAGEGVVWAVCCSVCVIMRV